MGALLVLMTGTKAFELCGAPVPAWYSTLQENKIMTMVGVFFLGNMVETSMLSSGAFEVTVNGEQVWSKMEMGYLPSLEHLISVIDEKLGVETAGFTPDIENLGGDF